MILMHIETEKVLDKVFRGVQLDGNELTLLRRFQSELLMNLAVCTKRIES